MNRSFEEKLSAISKPLRFASRDGFARLNTLKGVEPLVDRLCAEMLGPSVPEEKILKIKELRKLFEGFDEAPEAARKDAVLRAIAIVEGLGPVSVEGPVKEAPSVSVAAPSAAELGAIPTAAELASSLKRLSTPLEFVKGVGPKLAERFARKGLETVEDMLYFFPIRYEDRRRMKKVRELVPGEGASVMVEVLALGETRYGRRRVYEMAVGDGTGIMKLKWFNYRASYMKRYKQGQWLVAYGNVGAYGGSKEIIHPDIEIVDHDGEYDGAGRTPGLVPVYSQVENVHQKTLRRIVSTAVDAYASSFVAGAPPWIRARRGLMDPVESLRTVHALGDTAEGEGAVERAKRSLVFDELFALEIGLALKRRYAREEPGVAMAPGEGGLEARLRALLPFALTGAQERVLAEIKADMACPTPMNRIIQGDVGSGKTVVSFISALVAMEAGYQAAIMAPTEILAEQHYLSIHNYSESLGIKPLLLKGKMKKSDRSAALDDIREGRAGLVVGTHALIQKDVEFERLGLAIIDEQHRFGVVQRAELKKKAALGPEVSPDVLIMTATPIPRTLSMTVFGDLDVSVIDELPPGRSPVTTRIVREKERNRAYETIRAEVRSGGQAYIVYPLVEESEELPLRDATNMKEHLDNDIFPEFRVGLLHGRMKAAEKEEVMRAFKSREIDILVATTVVEVGVDVPNATVMVVEHAERFGLSQLHQLRGRVGRGTRQSQCLLLAQWTKSEDTYRRLKVMEETRDGFRIAEEDLNIRGPGDFLGTRQSGLPDFRLSFALTDLKSLKAARADAFSYIEGNPNLTGPDGEMVRTVMKARWAGRLELAEIG